MPHMRTATKSPTQQAQDRNAAAGPHGIALTPPAYGLHVVDRAAAGEVPLQRMPAPVHAPVQQAPTFPPNPTGLPDTLKASIESLSGYDLSDVRVHYHSSQPAQLQALAYTQGTDIYVAPGQEQHLPHEAWHVVQQAQGRVAPTMQMKDGVQVNDDQGLEHEAEVMGTKAVQMRRPDDVVIGAGTDAATAAQRTEEMGGASQVQSEASGASDKNVPVNFLSTGSQSGKELIAHALTHVVQQHGGVVTRKSMPKEKGNAKQQRLKQRLPDDNAPPKIPETERVIDRSLGKPRNDALAGPQVRGLSRDGPREAMRAIRGLAGPIIQLFPARLPTKENAKSQTWTTKIVDVKKKEDFDKFVVELVKISKQTGMNDPYTEAIDLMRAQEEKIPVGDSAWKDVVIRAVEAVRKAKQNNEDVTVEGIKQVAKTLVKGAKPAKVETTLNLADFLERCGFKYGNWTKYNYQTDAWATCAVREFPKVENISNIHATFFLDKSKETREVKGLPSMKAHLRLLHLTVENFPSNPKQNSRYWPLDGGKFTGSVLSPDVQEAVKQLWSKLKYDLETKAQGTAQ